METDTSKLLDQLIRLPRETSWLNFSRDDISCEEIGKEISALANEAKIANEFFAYLVFGINEKSHVISGTNRLFKEEKINDISLEDWLKKHLNPKIDFQIHNILYEGKFVSLFEIPSAKELPVDFFYNSYIKDFGKRVLLSHIPEKELIFESNEINWNETESTDGRVLQTNVLELFAINHYLKIKRLSPTISLEDLEENLQRSGFVVKTDNGSKLSRMGAVLFAKDFHLFNRTKNEGIRIIAYKGKNRLETIRQLTISKGYLIAWQESLIFLKDHFSFRTQEMGETRTWIYDYPENIISHILLNAILHKSYNDSNPMITVECFSDRIEVTNAGISRIKPYRFIDQHSVNNPTLMRCFKDLDLCESKGVGIDKAIACAEIYHLPAPLFKTEENRTSVTLFKEQKFRDMKEDDRMRACYQHCCLKYVSGETMCNDSLRERLSIKKRSSAMVSRLIKDAVNHNLIKEENPNTKSKKFKKYVPIWAE